MIDEIQQAEELAEAKFAQGETKGRAEAKTAAILAVLAARGIAVSAEARARIEACTDLGTLDRWIARAAAVTEAVLAPPA